MSLGAPVPEGLHGLVVRDCLAGADIDSRAVEIARSLLWLEGGTSPDRLVVGDSLADGSLFDGHLFDAVVGNGSVRHVQQIEGVECHQVRQCFVTHLGRVDGDIQRILRR